jgi:hypothetical protein
MSVIVTLRIDGDPAKLEEWAAANPDKMQGIVETAKKHGLVAHRFVGALDGGKMMVADEWPDPDSFGAFFAEAGSEIQTMMGEAGVTNEPQPEFWRTLETHDKYGWETA